jgi:hypothetical protein
MLPKSPSPLSIKTGAAGDQAAELLAIALEKISKFEPVSRE